MLSSRDRQVAFVLIVDGMYLSGTLRTVPAKGDVAARGICFRAPVSAKSHCLPLL